jgi:hypothetical protein
MIALDRELPQKCSWCPCFATIVARGDEPGEEWIVRRCEANGIILKAIKWKDEDLGPERESWYDFTKPDWCPWISIDGET